MSPDSWHWVAIAKLNKLRNLLAHNLAPAALDEKSQDYIDFIIKKSGNPLPVTDSSTASCDGTSARPRYLAVDMVTAGLYMYTSTLLLRLAPVELKVQQLSSALEALRPAKGDAG